MIYISQHIAYTYDNNVLFIQSSSSRAPTIKYIYLIVGEFAHANAYTNKDSHTHTHTHVILGLMCT